jgi:hypothetical protein
MRQRRWHEEDYFFRKSGKLMAWKYGVEKMESNNGKNKILRHINELPGM